jgi:KDO2-lipid IV(A) lauroyltransferase
MDERLTPKTRIERWVVRRAMAGGLSFTRLFSLRAITRLSRMLADFGYYLLSRNRKLAIANLSLVYGKTKSPMRIREMARETFREGARGGFELMHYFGRGHIEGTCELVKETEGLENLRRALDKGKGVVALSAHLGNFILLGAVLNRLGHPCATIMRQMRDAQLEEMFTDIRKEMGQNTIPKFPISRSVRESLKWLSQGNILAMYIDQRSKAGAIVDFMGFPTSTATGAAYFALRSGAPVLPMFVLRRGDGFYKLVIGPEVAVVATGAFKADVDMNTARFAKVVEEYIRHRPTQWFWFDRRWKQFHKKTGV